MRNRNQKNCLLKQASTMLLSSCLLFLSLGGVAKESEAPVSELTESAEPVSEVPVSEAPVSVELESELPRSEDVALTVEELKKKVIKLNRDLFILEEDLLFPANTQFTVFLSLDSGKFFTPDSVILKLNDQVIASHLYTERQQSALSRGGMQRLHIGNVKSGSHELSVVAVGKGTDGREVKRASSLSFEKGADVVAFEVLVKDQSEDYQSSVSIVKWDN